MSTKKIKKVKCAEIVCDLEYEENGIKKTFDVKKAKRKLDQLRSKGMILFYVFCVHDKDRYTEEEEEKGEGKAGELKKPHIHIFIKLGNDNGRTFKDIGAWFGLAANFVEKLKGGRFDNSCVYVIHLNAPEKYQYSISEAVWDGFDFEALVELKKKQFKREKNKDRLYQRKMEICKGIEEGVINPFNIHTCGLVSMEDWINFEPAIKKAFERRAEQLEQNNDRTMECVYIAGKTMACKTSLAKMLLEKYASSYIICNSYDPLQNYKGQKGVCIDDISFNTLGWKDFLNMADNDTSTPVKSRFKNKSLYCDLLIITTTKEPYELVQLMDGAKDEDKKQFYRRFKTYYYADYDFITEYRFNSSTMKYEFIRKIKNVAVPVMAELRRRKDKDIVELDIVEAIKDFANKKCVLILDKEEITKETKEERKANEEIEQLDLTQLSNDINDIYYNPHTDFF